MLTDFRQLGKELATRLLARREQPQEPQEQGSCEPKKEMRQPDGLMLVLAELSASRQSDARMTAEAVAKVADAVERLSAALMAPKTIVSDDEGNPVRVEVSKWQ